jgi:drug/metabolite transporter (DMT)-like permease
VHDPLTRHRVWTGTDALVLTAAIVWGANYSVIKVVLREVTPIAFAGLRLLLATGVFLAAIGISRWLRGRGSAAADADAGSVGARVREVVVDVTPGGASNLAVFRTSTLSRRDWMLLALLGLIGHFLYQICFIEGLARTTVANASLVIGCTPMVVAIVSAAIGSERLGPMHWVGTALSLAGIYLVVGRGDGAGATGLTGDLLMAVSVVCWAVYTLVGRELLRRHSPLVVTGYSMAFGTLLFLMYAGPVMLQTDWLALERDAWLGIAYATFLAFNVSYMLWYTGVQRLGSARTSLYSNLVPIVSLAVAALWLGERLGWVKIAGAAAVLSGLALTRVQLPRSAAPRPQ